MFVKLKVISMKPYPTDEQIKNAYFTNKRLEMISFIPCSCKVILDVGCGEGNFGSQLKNERRIIVWGIEPDEKASIKAKLVLDQVFTDRFEQAFPDLPKDFFDCIVFNDVLEHLNDPGTVLKSCLSLLHSNGYIVSSIPNVRYIGNLYELLVKKDWEYKQGGILDQTHYRFFTQKSIKHLFKSCGYNVIRCEGINPTHSMKTKLLIWISLGHLSDIKFLQFATIAQVP